MLGFLFMFLMVALVVLGLLGALRGFGYIAPVARDPSGPALAPGELGRLEEAITTLESRLERLEDQQRFIERLLAERPATRALPSAEEESD